MSTRWCAAATVKTHHQDHLQPIASAHLLAQVLLLQWALYLHLQPFSFGMEFSILHSHLAVLNSEVVVVVAKVVVVVCVVDMIVGVVVKLPCFAGQLSGRIREWRLSNVTV